jgi:hypothetical protein
MADHNTKDARLRLSADLAPRSFWRALRDPGHYRFAFVRNPYTRAVSAYLEKITTGEKHLHGVGADASLRAFLERLATIPPSHMNRHWRPQSALISTKVRLNFLGRFENFAADFATVRSALGVREEVTFAPHRTDAAEHLSLIGPREKALIDAIYAEDFARFGYAMRVG